MRGIGAHASSSKQLWWIYLIGWNSLLLANLMYYAIWSKLILLASGMMG